MTSPGNMFPMCWTVWWTWLSSYSFNHVTNAFPLNTTRFHKKIIRLRCLENVTIKMPTHFQIRFILQHHIANYLTFKRFIFLAVISCGKNNHWHLLTCVWQNLWQCHTFVCYQCPRMKNNYRSVSPCGVLTVNYDLMTTTRPKRKRVPSTSLAPLDTNMLRLVSETSWNYLHLHLPFVFTLYCNIILCCIYGGP